MSKISDQFHEPRHEGNYATAPFMDDDFEPQRGFGFADGDEDEFGSMRRDIAAFDAYHHGSNHYQSVADMNNTQWVPPDDANGCRL